MIKQYILWNWGMILILAAFAVSLKETVFLDKTTIRRMYILIVAVFLCSVGCCYLDDGAASVDDLLQRSDSMMYAEKAAYYRSTGRDRRRRREPSAEGR